jgi:hypothetical protein
MTLSKRTALAAAVAAAVLLPWLVRLHAGEEQKKDEQGLQQAARKESLDQITKTINALQKKLQEQETKYDEFRHDNPLILVPKPERRLEAMDAALEKFQLRRLEIDDQLQILEEAQKEKVAPEAMLLLVSRLPGGNSLLTFRGEGKQTTPAELIKQYSASLQWERKYISLHREKLFDLHQAAQEQARHVARYLNEDRHFRDSINRTRQTLEPLIRRLEDFKITADLDELQKKKDK